jgi:hypothetical protein
MNASHFKALGLAVAVLSTALAGPAVAADQWKEKGKDCDAGVFKQPSTADLDDLIHCTKLWVAYRQDLKDVKGDYKNKVVLAMKLVYQKAADDGDANRAKLILGQLGESDLPARAAAPAKPKTPPRKAFKPPEPSKKDIAAADRQFKLGYKAYKSKDYDKAAEYYVKMVDAAPGYAKGHFNAACAYALKKDEANMAKYLMNLRDMSASGNKDAAEMLKLVKTDADFNDIKDDSVEYKKITGYAKILIINDLGEMGEENVDNLVGSLKKLGYVTQTKGSDKKPLKRPFIFFADHAKPQAYIVKKVINHPKVETKLLSKDKLCNDDGCFDVVIQWSDDVKKDEPKVFVSDPDDAEDKLDKLEKEQDEILSKPDDAMDEVDEALGKPEEVQDRVDENLERPGKAVDKVEKTVDKIKDVF